MESAGSNLGWEPDGIHPERGVSRSVPVRLMRGHWATLWLWLTVTVRVIAPPRFLRTLIAAHGHFAFQPTPRSPPPVHSPPNPLPRQTNQKGMRAQALNAQTDHRSRRVPTSMTKFRPGPVIIHKTMRCPTVIVRCPISHSLNDPKRNEF